MTVFISLTTAHGAGKIRTVIMVRQRIKALLAQIHFPALRRERTMEIYVEGQI